MLQTWEQEKGESGGERTGERDWYMKRSHVSIPWFSIHEAMRQMGAVRSRLQEGEKKSSPHERRTARPVEVGEGGMGALIDVLRDLGLRHTHMEMTPRPAQRSRQSKS